MALAILQYEGSPGGAHDFRFDLGSNRFFAYAVGGDETVAQDGVRLLDDPVRGPIAGPLPESARGRGRMSVPDDRFDRDHRAIQLWSYRTREGDGPAVSAILRLPRGLRPDDGNLPPPAFAASVPQERPAMMRTVPLVREQRLSEAMFFDMLASLVPKLLPMAGQILPMIGNLFGGAGGGAPKAVLGGVEKLLADPKNQEIINALIKQFAEAKSMSFSRARSMGNGHSDRNLSKAMIAPALLAALPALMPVLEKALNPETIKAIMDGIDPSKVIGVVSGALKDFANIGIQANEANTKWLRSLHPDLKDPAMDKLFEGLSLSRSVLKERANYRRVNAVTARFEGAPAHVLAGRTRVLYRHGRDLGLPLRIDTPKPIRAAKLRIVVKDPRSLRILSKTKIAYPRVESGLLSPDPVVPAARVANLRPGDEVLVCATLTWKGRSGGRLGTSVSQLVTLAGGVMFGRVEEGAQVVPLNNVEKHRAYFHKVWQASLTREDRRYELECKYYTSADREARENARMETKIGVERQGLWRQRGRLKSGIVLSIPALNALLPRETGHPALADEDLQALMTPEFAERFHRAGRTRVELEGREGDSVALWVYPEMRVHDVILSRAAEVDRHGRVIRLDEHAAKFLFPADLHFVGVTTAP